MNHMKFPYLPACCLSKTYSDDTLLPSRPWHNDFVFYSVCISLANIFQDTILNSSFYLCLTTRPLCELGGGKKKQNNDTNLEISLYSQVTLSDLSEAETYVWKQTTDFILGILSYKAQESYLDFFLLTRVLSIRPSGIQGLARFDLSCNSADLCGSVRVYGEGMCMYKLFWFGSAWCGWWWRGSTQTKTFILPFQSFLVYQKRIFFSHVVFSEKVLFCNVSFQLWKTVRNDCRSSIYDISLLGTAISLLTFLSIT